MRNHTTRKLILGAVIAGLTGAPVLAADLIPTTSGIPTTNTDPMNTKADRSVLNHEDERMVIAAVQEVYGPTATMNTGTGLPDSVHEAIVEGSPLPAGAPVEPVPQKLAGKLPQPRDGGEWVKVGKHLIALAPDQTVRLAVFHALP